jgi:SAM-dependent methyltransferase
MRGIEQIPWLYDAILAFSEWRGLAEWRRWLTGGARGRTLDLGCGTGRNLTLFAADVRAIGVDPAFDSLRKARRRAPTTPLVCGSAEALPFRAEAFETVVCGLVLCSVPDPARGLAEIRRAPAARCARSSTCAPRARGRRAFRTGSSRRGRGWPAAVIRIATPSGRWRRPVSASRPPADVPRPTSAASPRGRTRADRAGTMWPCLAVACPI